MAIWRCLLKMLKFAAERNAVLRVSDNEQLASSWRMERNYRIYSAGRRHDPQSFYNICML